MPFVQSPDFEGTYTRPLNNYNILLGGEGFHVPALICVCVCVCAPTMPFTCTLSSCLQGAKSLHRDRQ